MAEKRNIKAKIWVYAVVLFTSAFIVLLITAYVQIKQQRSINDYKTQISVQQNENKKFQLSYANAQEMIDKLTGDNDNLTADNKSYNDTIDKLNNDLNQIKEESDQQIAQYEKLCEAQSEYLKGNIVACAQLLKNIDPKDLDGKAAEAYSLISGKAIKEAGSQLFEEGYKLYQNSKYTEAIEKLSLCRDISNNEDFSDNCLYYLAYAKHRSGQTAIAVDMMKTLIQEYPSSSFIKYARIFIQKFE